MGNEEINIGADFHTFRSQIIQKFGEQYYDQAEIFFTRATEQAQQGLFHSALADGKFALELTNYSNDTSGIHYIFGFLSQLHFDLRQVKKSLVYYELGLKLLDPEAADYEEDREMYRKLKEMIDSESWKQSAEDDLDS